MRLAAGPIQLAPPRRQRRPAGGRRRLGDAPGAAAGARPRTVARRLRAARAASACDARSCGATAASTGARTCSSGSRAGRYAVEEARAAIEDPFGLARAEVELPAGGALVVYPRLVALDRLFSESGAHAQDGRRLLLRRPSGFDLHSVREYERGESLRKVHWPTTARRGQLMVKELEDAPRDEIAVVLDADAGAVAGESFDVQVRAAGSILRAHAAHGRRAVLALNTAAPPEHAGAVARGRLARGARAARGGRARRDEAASSSCSRARPGLPPARSRPSS